MNLDKMMHDLLDKRFNFGGQKEDSHEKEDGSRTSSHSHDDTVVAEEEFVEDPAIAELKSRLRDAQAKASSYRDKAEAATERVSLFQEEVAEITKEAVSLKTQLEESLNEKAVMANTIDELKSESDKAKLYHDRAIEATKEAVSLKVELRASRQTQISLQTTIDELQKEVETSQQRVKELEEMVDSMRAESVETQQQLASHVKVISDLTAEHGAGGFQKNPTSEQMLLLEATQKLKLKDYEFRKLNEKILSLESKIKNRNDVDDSDNYRIRFHELQKSYNGVIAQNEEMYHQLHSTKKTNEQLRNQKEAVTRKELERVASMKQYQKELDARDDHVFFLEKHIENLEKKLSHNHKVKEEEEDGTSTKTQEVILLENKIAELEQKLQMDDMMLTADLSGVVPVERRSSGSRDVKKSSATCCCSTPTDITTGQMRKQSQSFKYAIGVAFLSIFLGSLLLILKKHLLVEISETN